MINVAFIRNRQTVMLKILFCFHDRNNKTWTVICHLIVHQIIYYIYHLIVHQI